MRLTHRQQQRQRQVMGWRDTALTERTDVLVDAHADLPARKYLNGQRSQSTQPARVVR